MNQSNQAANSKDFKQFIKKLLEDLASKTQDMAVNKSISYEAIQSPVKPSSYPDPQTKQSQQLYNKILVNLAQYHLKNQGSKIDQSAFSNIVNKMEKKGIMNFMLKHLKLNQQTAQFLTQQLVLGLQCRQAVKQVGAEVLKMQTPFAGQCKQFMEKAKTLALAKSKQAYLRQDEVSDLFTRIQSRHFDLAQQFVRQAIVQKNHQLTVMNYINQQKNINESICKLETLLNTTYLKYRSDDKVVRKYEDSVKTMAYLTSEVESRSKMMANFIEQLEKADIIRSSIQKSVSLSEKLENMAANIKNVDNEIKKLQKVKSSYEELQKIQQQHLNDIKKVRTNVRKKQIVLQVGFQKKLGDFQQKIKKHLQDKCSLDENNKYLNAQINCKPAELLQSSLKINEMEDDRQKLKKLEQLMQVKERELEGLKTKIKELESCSLRITQKNKQLEHRIREVQNAKVQMAQEKRYLKQQCEVFEAQRQKFEGQKNSLLEQIHQLETQIKAQSNKPKEQQHNRSPPSQPQEHTHYRPLLTTIVEVRPTQSNQLKTAIAETQQLKQQLSDLQAKHYRLSNQLQSERSQRQQLQKTDISNKQSIEQLQFKLSSQQNQHLKTRSRCIVAQQNLNKSIVQKEEQISALRASLKHIQSEFSNSQQVYEQRLGNSEQFYEQTLFKANQQARILRQQQQKLLQNVETLKEKLQTAQSQLQQRRKETNPINSSATFKEQLANIPTEKQTIRTQLQTADNNVRELSAKLESAQATILELSAQLQAEKDNNNSNSQQIQSDSQQQMQLLNLKTEEQAAQIHIKEKEATQSLHKVDELEKKVAEVEAKLKQKQAQSIELTTQLLEFKQKTNHLETQITRLSSQIEEKTITIEYKISQIQSLASQLRTEESQRDSLKEEMRVKEQQIVKWQQKAKQYQKQLQNKKAMIQKQNRDLLRVKQAALQEKDTILKQNQLFETHIEDLSNQLKYYQSKNNELQIEKDTMQTQKIELQTEINQLSKLGEELQHQKENLQISISQLHIKNLELSSRIGHLTDDNSALERSILSLKQELDQASLQLTSKQSQIKDLEEKKNQACSQLDKLPKDTYFYYQEAAAKLKTGMLDLILADRLLQGDMMKEKVQYKHFIIDQLQRFEGKQITQTKLIYKFDRNIYRFQCEQKHKAKVDFHNYIDGTNHMLVIVKSINGKFLAGYNSGEYSNKAPILTKGLLISLLRNQVFELFGPATNRRLHSRAMIHDPFNINFGNSELRMKWTDPNKQELFSNFGVSNGYYNNRGFKVDALLGEGEKRETFFEDFEIYEVIYEKKLGEISEIPEVISRSSIR